MSFASVLERLQKVENPYPGLRPFDETEAHLYYGRDPQIEELVSRLERQSFLAVVGVSGSGKSSLVLAGLIPALQRRGSWRIIRMRPQADPYGELSKAASIDSAKLRSSSFGLIKALGENAGPVLVVVDQFEELFRYKDQRGLSTEQRNFQASASADFVQLLLNTSREAKRIDIVITMRSDYLGSCAEFRDLPETLNGAQYLVPRLTREQLREAIEGPLGRTRIAPPLVQRLLNDVGDDPGRLPILQHALMRTWNRWKQDSLEGQRAIEIEDYENIGGITGALDRHADELLAGFSEQLVRIIFQRLTARGPGERERRDPATVSELHALCESDEVYAALDRFRKGDATFLTPREGDLKPHTYVDFTHESLIWNWTKLKQWIDQEQKHAKTYQELIERAERFKPGVGPYLTDLDLGEAVIWRADRNQTKTWAAHYAEESKLQLVLNFVSASEQAEKQAEEHAAEIRNRELRQQKRLTRLAGIFVLVLSFLLFLLGRYAREAEKARSDAVEKGKSAISGERKARDAKDVADRAEKEAISQTKVAKAEKQRAEEQKTIADDERAQAEHEARRNLAHELAGAADNLIDQGGDESLSRLLALEAVSLSHRAHETVEKEAEQALKRITERSTGGLLPYAHAPAINALAYNLDGSLLVTANSDGTAQVWDTASGLCKLRLAGHDGNVYTVAFSPNGKLIATGGQDKTARIWDATSGKQQGEPLTGHSEVLGVAFSPDGKLLATANKDGTARLWDVLSQRVRPNPMHHSDSVNALAFISNGEKLVTASADNDVKLWETSSGRDTTPQQPAFHHPMPINAVAVSSDGTLLATASQDKMVRIWSMTGVEIQEFLQKAEPRSVAFSKDGSMLAVAGGTGGTATLWQKRQANDPDKPFGDEPKSKDVCEGVPKQAVFVNAIAFSPDGRRFATACKTTVSVWDSFSGRPWISLGRDERETLLAVSSDGKMLAFRRNDGRTGIRDSWSRLELFTLAAGSILNPGIGSFSANAKFFVLSENQKVQVWDMGNGNKLREFGTPADATAISVSSDGERVAMVSLGRLSLWNAATGECLNEFPERNMLTVVFSPDPQSRILATGNDGNASLRYSSSGDPKPLHRTGGKTIAFDGEGTLVATAGLHDRTLQIWKADSGRLVTEKPHGAGIIAAAFSPDSSSVATYGSDKSVKVWSIGRGDPKLSVKTHEPANEPATYLAFDPEGQHLLLGSTSSRVETYSLSDKALIEDALSELKRSWSNQECETYLHSKSCAQWVRALSLIAEANNWEREGNPNAAAAKFHESQVAYRELNIDVHTILSRLEEEKMLASGLDFAASGKEGDALKSFTRAKELFKVLGFDPERAAKLYTAAAYLTASDSLALADERVEESREAYHQAEVLDPDSAAQHYLQRGMDLMRHWKVTDALRVYSEALSAQKRFSSVDPDGKLRADLGNFICYQGSLHGYVREVLTVCENDKISPQDWSYRDSRGVSRALRGQTQAAIEDFEYFINHSDNESKKQRRQHWIDDLINHKDPDKIFETTPPLGPASDGWTTRPNSGPR